MWTIDSWYREARASAEAEADFLRKMADLRLRTLEDHVLGMKRDEVVRRLQEVNRQRLNAVPDLAKYPELRGMRELIDEARRKPTLEGMRRFIQFRSPERGNVCGNGEILFPGGPESEYTLKTSVWLLREGRAMWWAREGNKPSFENQKSDVLFKDVWLWDQD